MLNPFAGEPRIDVHEVTMHIDALLEDPDHDANELLECVELMGGIADKGGAFNWKNAWYPALLIRADEFAEYVQELAKDIGAVHEEHSWVVVDWDETASRVAVDYTTVTFGDHDYMFR